MNVAADLLTNTFVKCCSGQFKCCSGRRTAVIYAHTHESCTDAMQSANATLDAEGSARLVFMLASTTPDTG